MAFPVLSAMLALPLLGTPIGYLIGRSNIRAAKFFYLAVAMATFLVSLIGYTMIDFSSAGYQLLEIYKWAPQVGIQYIVGADGISYPLVLLTTFMSLPAMAASWHIEERVNAHYALLLFIEGALLGVFFSLDLFLFFVFWEIVLVPMYFLIGVWGGPRKEYAAIKFFIYTHLGSLFLLLVILALYFKMEPHTFNMIEIAKVSPGFSKGFQVIAFAAMLFGFLVKLPSWPFHTWLPDAHVEAPTAGSIHLAALLLKMAGYAIIRLGLMLTPEGAKALAWVMIILGVISGYYAAFCAMAQKDIKKLIAYSSISHMGYALLGIAMFNPLAIKGAIYMFVAHGFISGALFFFSGSIHHKVGTRIIGDIEGFAKKTPHFMVLFSLTSLAAFGMPGFAGFVAEFLIFLGVFQVFKAVAIITVFSIIITAGYFLWTIQRVGFTPPLEKLPEHIEDLEPWTELLPMAVVVAVIIIFGIYPSPLLNMMEASVNALVASTGGLG